MPPPDFAPYRKVMPSGGVANIIASAVPGPIFLTDANGISYDAAGNIVQGPSTVPVMSPSEAAAAGAAEAANSRRVFDAEMQDPTFAALVAEQKAANEPWSAYLGSVAANAKNTAQAFLPTALGGRGEVGVSDIAKGAAESALSGATLPGDALAGRGNLFNAQGQPTEELIARGTDFTGMMTLGAGAIPAEANSLRMGMTALTGHPKNPEGSLRKAEIRSGGLYSKAEDVLQNWDQKEGTFEQFKAYLKKAGVKQPEIEALTKNYNPGDRVNKQQLINTLMAEEPEIKVVETNYFGDDGYNMPGGTNYRMMNITWDNPSPTYGMHPYRYTLHNLPDNTLVHARLKDDVYTGADGVDKKVLRVEELQSDWAQQGRGRWAIPATPERIKMQKVPVDQFVDDWLKRNAGEIKNGSGTEQSFRAVAQMMVNEARAAGHSDITLYRVDGVTTNNWQILGSGEGFTPEELFAETRDTYGEELKKNGVSEAPLTATEEMFFNEQFGQSPAPFVTQGSAGVVPLAVKRLLLEAAQNDQDEIVFAPGSVHAQRWGRSNPVAAEGLKAFYDDVLPRELQDVVKDVSKVTGVKGIKVEREPRPFVPKAGTKPREWYEESFDTWFENMPYAQQADMGFRVPNSGTPDEVAAHTEQMDALKNVNSRLSFRLGQGLSIETALGELNDLLGQEIRNTQSLINSNQILIDQYENVPYDRMTPEIEENLKNAYYRKNFFQKQVEDIQVKVGLLPKALGLYKAWDKEVNLDRRGGEALVIKLTPDLREYIKKNGLPRFAKGGIVDLATHAARAGNIHGALA